MKWQAVVRTVMKLRGPKILRIFSTEGGNIGFVKVDVVQ